MSISNTYVSHSVEKFSVNCDTHLSFSKERYGFRDNWGGGFVLLKESLSQGGSSWSLLISLVND